MARVVAAAWLCLYISTGFRAKKSQVMHASEAATCAAMGCFGSYDKNKPCQCNKRCASYGNCCADFKSVCSSFPSPSPSPSSPSPSPNPGPKPPGPKPPAPSPAPVGAAPYWGSTNMTSASAIKDRMLSGYTKLSYDRLWTAYKSVWVNVPGGNCGSKIFDVYSSKCWTPGRPYQCTGGAKKEGECYNREHSWPKSWWGKRKNTAYSDMFHVMPSDGYVNNKRSNWPFGEVSSPVYTSPDGHKVGPCATPGYDSTCFEPLDSIKGLMARGHLYLTIRYANEYECCETPGVNRMVMKPWYSALMKKWHSQFPPGDMEKALNDRIQGWQGNRNPFIDFPELANQLIA